ncbi:MAG: hypothetical protein KC586_16880, partial [Myxococcales bacterium]|nr:hypothetical protein [Myxococcales bacterium]
MFVAIWNLVAKDDAPRTVAFTKFEEDVIANRVESVRIQPQNDIAQFTFVVKVEGDRTDRKVTMG